MLFKQALKQVQKNKELKEYESNGYFLNSGISLLPADCLEIGDWIFTYYNPDEGMVVEAIVSESVEVKPPGKPTKPTTEELGTKKIKTNSDKMMEKAVKEFKKLKKPLSQAIVTVQGTEPKWHFNFITKTLEIAVIEVDAGSGTVLKSEVESLTRTLPKEKP